MEPAPARPRPEAIDRDDRLVREWQVARLSGLGNRVAAGPGRRRPRRLAPGRHPGAPRLPATARAAVAGPGVTGKLGTIKRADGTIQATYNGHPLYTYIGDTAPGQAHGNRLNLNGGLWHETTTSSHLATHSWQSAGRFSKQPAPKG